MRKTGLKVDAPCVESFAMAETERRPGAPFAFPAGGGRNLARTHEGPAPREG